MAENDTHTTDGERYRTPSHPQVIAALGRAMWNFLSLEESVVAILYEAKEMDLGSARSLMAGGKEQALKTLKRRLEREAAPPGVTNALQGAIDAFHEAREEYRNALSHATPFTAGYDEDGTYLPGLELTSKSRGRRLAHDAQDLHNEAHRIEDAIDPLSAARTAIREFVGFSG